MDATWPDSAVYACPCGTLFAVTYWRWVDVVARPELETQVQRDGPFEGACTRCGAAPRSAATWLRIDPGSQSAALQLSEARRGHVLDELRAHLSAVEQRPHAVSSWILQPQQTFYELDDEGAAKAQALARVEAQPVAAARSGELFIDVPPPPTAAALEISTQTAKGGAPDAGVPQIIGTDMRTPGTFRPPVLGAYVGDLALEETEAVAFAEVAPEERPKWTGAKLTARPLHLRGLDYPLLGVRIIAAYMGQKAVIDALVDPGHGEASDIFRALSKSFSLRLSVSTGDGEDPIDRTVTAENLESNAALCLESARSLLARGEYPPRDFDKAKEQLAAMSVETRLEPTKVTISPGAYQHVIGAAEAGAALAHLDRVSNKEYLARLLEVDGMPMGEYDALRRRVLAGSLEHGLVAPRRFWRRVVASGLAPDLATYARLLAENRLKCEGEEGDLEAEAAQEAWTQILELCKRKELAVPGPVSRALGLDESSGPPPPPSTDGTDGSDGPDEMTGAADAGSVQARLRDPSQRLKVAADVLQGREGGRLEQVFDAIDDFDTDELLALLPDLSELGPRAVPNLVEKLDADRREVRQAAAILLGLALDPEALERLSQRLIIETTNVWLDLARAIGSFGPTALRRLCQVLRRQGGTEYEQQAIERVARALAEVALSDGQVGPGDPSPGHDAVAALADARDPRVKAAARRALATLRDVSESGAVMRGELPLHENTEVRGFARRAYEAIMVPEVEVEAEA